MRNSLKLAAAAAALISAPAYAGTDTAQMDVTANVINSCTVTATPMAFGSLTTLGTANIDSTATISLACTPDAPYDVALDVGANAAGAQRNLVNTTDASQLVPYGVYSDAAHSSTWGSAAGSTVTGTAAAGVATLTAYGRIPASATAVTAGSYTDSVTVTVSF